MALIDLWLESPAQVRDKQVRQIIAFAGDGQLRDGTLASREFRDLLSRLPTEFLARYANECLTDSFPHSGLALQDVVNELGRRLGFEVEFGRYRGAAGKSGFDGVWFSATGYAIVVEVKTTDAYRIDLETLAGYRKVLVKDGRIEEASSSILIIVGRQDTGDLEAQIRGSRHAWDVRLLSVEALLRLVLVKEDLEDPAIIHRIHQILVPREFTRLDEIVGVLFSTAEDLKEETEPGELEDEGSEALEKKFTPVAFHRACVDRIGAVLETQFVKKSRASFYSPDESSHLVCAVSREYLRSGRAGYWFAFHPHQREFLQGAEQTYVAFGCGSPDHVLLIPFPEFEPLLDDLDTTDTGDRSYWHVRIIRDGNDFTLMRSKGHETVNLSRYVLPS